MKNLIFVFILIFCSTLLLSQTTIPGGDVSGTWLQSGSPYLIEGEITIPDGETLTIDPGCLIEFQGHYEFNVQGRLLAIGTEQDSIVFTALDSNSGWQGIRFDNTPAANDSSKIVYCHLEFGKAVGVEDDRFGGAIFIKNYSNLLIDYSLFEYCEATSQIITNFVGKGGAIALFDNSDIKIQNCKFINNKSYYGGGIYCKYSDPLIENCLFAGNISDWRGGGIAFYYSDSQIINCTFIENSSIDISGTGGGGYCHSCNDMEIIGCKFFNNFAQDGGGIYFGGDQKLVNCLITNNTAEVSGGGITFNSSNCNIINCTIAKNEAPVGGGINCKGNDPSIINTIIYNNGFSNVNINDNYQHSVDPFFLFCDIEYGLEGFTGGGAAYYITTHYQNCIESYPKFIDPTIGNGINFNGLEADYSIGLLSPCINHGNPDTTSLNLPEYDLAGNVRIYSEIVDIGAYENFDYFTNFSASPTEGQMPLTVNFQDYSNGLHTWWEWDFNSDGIIDSYEIDPTFTYDDDGLYTVTLTSGNSIEADTEIKENYINVQYVLDAEFITDIVSGITPLTVNFTDMSIGDVQSWEWDFENDGVIDSYEQNPTGCYIYPGVYSVKLIVSDGNLFSEELKNDLITVYYQNELSGIIEEDTTLTADTINVIGEVTVLDGVTLTINPGVTMLFHDHYKLNIQGRLLAVGTEQDSIWFTTSDTTGYHNNTHMGWHGIRFDNTPVTNDSSKIVYCHLEFGKAIGGNWNDRSGGAVYIDDFSKILISNCKFKNNYANSSGGAIFDGGGIRIDNSIISNNQSNGNGGGIGVNSGSIISNSLVESNSSSSGGGISIYGYPSCQINNLTIHSNTGVGLSIGNNSNIINCKITNNQSGGIYIEQSSPDIINCLISNNGDTGIYAWDEIWSDSYPNIVNCTVTNNDGYGIYYLEFEWWPDRKDEKYIENEVRSRFFRNRSLTGYSTILSGNTNGSVGYNENCPGLLYCSFSESVPSFAGTGCISIEPYFVNPTVGAGPDYNALEADWSIQSNSMCINHGIPDTTGLNIPELDLAGNPRIYQGENPRIDIGAYEFQGEPDMIPDIYANPTELNFGLCTINQISLMKNFTISNFGYVNLEINSITATTGFLIKREDDPEFNPIIESFNIEPYEEETINVVFNPTSATNYIGYIVIDSNDPDEGLLLINTTGTGDIWPVVQGHITEDTFWDADTIKVVGDIIIDDSRTLTISPGVYIQFHGYYSLNVQGRILAEGTLQDSITFIIADTSSPYNFWQGIKMIDISQNNEPSIFNNCTFKKAKPRAICLSNIDSLKIINCLFENNYGTPGGTGGAIWSGNSNITIKRSIFRDNIVWAASGPQGVYEAGEGGGLGLEFSVAIIENCKFFNNYVHWGDYNNSKGGAIYAQFSDLIIKNSLIHDNNAQDGAGIYLDRSSVNCINSTISYNNGGGVFNGIFLVLDSDINLTNSISWENGNYEIVGIDSTQEIIISYSCIKNGIYGINLNNAVLNWLEGNIEDDPLFIDPENGNFHFFSGSPCINAGTPDTTGLNLPEYDLDGNPRIYEDRIDMGCYEWQGTGADNYQLPMTSYQLSNHPNPFNPETKITFSIAGSEDNKQKVSISVFNIRGQKVKTLVDETMEPGRYSIIWNSKDRNGKPVSSGIYFYQLNVDGKMIKSRKMLLLK